MPYGLFISAFGLQASKLVAWFYLFPSWFATVQHDLLQLAQSFGVVQKVVMLRAKNQVCFDNYEIEAAACHSAFFVDKLSLQ